MRYRSEMSTSDRIDECKDSARDVVDMCGELIKVIRSVHRRAIEVERQLNLTDADMEDSYHPVVQSLKLIEEIIDETT